MHIPTTNCLAKPPCKWTGSLAMCGLSLPFSSSKLVYRWQRAIELERPILRFFFPKNKNKTQTNKPLESCYFCTEQTLDSDASQWSPGTVTQFDTQFKSCHCSTEQTVDFLKVNGQPTHWFLITILIMQTCVQSWPASSGC